MKVFYGSRAPVTENWAMVNVQEVLDIIITYFCYCYSSYSPHFHVLVISITIFLGSHPRNTAVIFYFYPFILLLMDTILKIFIECLLCASELF